MPVQLNIFLLLFGGLQGLILSVFLVQRKVYRSAYVFLVAYIVVMILQILLKVVSKIWLMQNLLPIYIISYRFPFLYGPLVYFLTIFLLDRKRRFTPLELFHFIPFPLAVITVFYYINTGHDSYFVALFMDGGIAALLQLLSIVIYHGLALYACYQHHSSVKNYFSNTRQFQFKWLRQFIWCSAIICTIITAAIYFMYVYFPRLSDLKFVFALLTVFIYWVSYVALKQPQLFSVVYGNANEEISSPSIAKLVVHRSEKKYVNSGLNEEEVARVISALEKLVAAQKVFLDAEITIEKLAGMIPCSRHHLSQILNEKLSRSFYDYINGHRVEEAKLLLGDPSRADHKISSIAYDSGFNSLSTFNEVFRKFTGQTPSQFRKLQENLSRKQRV